ncbi:MAG: hypothetical protein E6G92_07435 [Alphaproteobacteria bacterium]|nr:MAG: hypothetical protein E6G92_07435 [Alphaproteobacteria bacterium]
MNAVAGRRGLSPLLWIVIALIVLAAIAWLAGAFDGWRGRGAPARAGIYVGAFQVCSQPTAPIPAGFDFPQPEGTVAQWVQQGNEARAREHGWFVWAGLNSATGAGPVWRTWCTSTQAFTGEGSAAMAASHAIGGRLSLGARRRAVGGAAQAGEDPISFPVSPVYTLPAAVLNNPAYQQAGCIRPATSGIPAALNDGPTLESNGDIMVAGVVYNDSAFNSIRGQNLYQPATLERMLPAPGQQQPNWPRLAANSVALKPMMWPVPQTGYWALPVWDNLESDNGAYSGFEISGQWRRAVAVSAETPAAGTRDVSLLTNGGIALNGAPLGPNLYPGAPVHSIDEFYGFQPDLASMTPCDRAILDASSYWAYNRPFQQGDYLIVVAMHIMTREQADWTFQSVWWHDRPDAGPFAANRPDIPGAPGPWRHYLMTSTYGFQGPPGPRGPQWPIAYNPYIELAANHPIRTNCMNCHHRAAAPGEPPPPAPSPPWPVGSYEAGRLMCGAPVPDALDVYAQDNAIFNSLLLVDSIWSISDRVPVSRSGAAAAGPRPGASAASCPSAARAGAPRRR